MKMQGKTVDAKFVVPVVIPRPGSESFVFQCQPLTAEQNTFFAEACPRPKPKNTLFRGETEPRPDATNPQYLEAMKLWSKAKSDYLFIASLEATEDLEWDSVVVDDPTTWDSAVKELLTAGFLDGEVAALYRAVAEANGLDGKKIDEATKDFLATQALLKS